METLIENAGLSQRTVNGLARGGYVTMEDVLLAASYELLRIPEFGRKSLNEIEQWARDQSRVAGNDRDLKMRQLRAAEERLTILQRDIASLKRQLGIGE